MKTKKNKKYIPINKGHFQLDTQERSDAFHDKLGAGWEDEYKEYRSDWNNLPKIQQVRDYPLHVDLELSSRCNLTCSMCYTITDDFISTIQKGFMEFDLFKKVIDEIVGKVHAVRLSLRGEPTMNKIFRDAIKYAKDKGIGEVSTLTNGSALKGKFMRDVVDNGLDWLTISIDGMGDNYNKIRKPLTFDKMLNQLKELQEYKREKGVNKPVVKVQGIWPAIRPYPTKYYETLAPVTDLVAYNPLIDYLFNDKDIIYEDNFSCPQPYQRLTIYSDGTAAMCANAGYGDDKEGYEKVGDANKESVHDIWHGVIMQKVRDTLSKKDGFKNIKTCLSCYYPRKTKPNEKAKVGDREIFIENYINRKQEVGL
jgi:MoaA/NifB/PqqE/SkfB family radical SAM enzyme